MRFMNRKNTRYLLLASACLAGLLNVVNAQAREFDIKRNYVQFDGNRYFVRNSSAVTVGTYGDKKTPATQQNYLLRHADFRNTGGILSTPPQYADNRSDTSLFHDGTFSMPIKLVNLKISTSAYVRMIQQKKCSFVREYAESNGALMRNLNASPAMINYLKDKNSSRIVNDVIRVKSCMISNRTLHDVSVNGNVNLASLGIELRGKDRTKGETEVTFRFGKDTVIGYRMLKFDWDKQRKNKRTRIVRVEDDGQSFN